MQVLDQFLNRVTLEIVNPILLLISAGAFVLFLWGVFSFIRNGADSTKRAEGQSAILWGIIGLVIIFGVFGIINVALRSAGLDPIEETLLPSP
jgi:cytosine/uracil/thiamine/allantoin permease